MSKFDTLYENIKWSLREDVTGETNYAGSKVFDYMKNLVGNLVARNLLTLSNHENEDRFVKDVLSKQSSPYELHLNVDQDVPPVKVSVVCDSNGDQEEDSDISIIVSQNNQSQTFGGSTPYSDPTEEAISYIETLVQAKANAPENAVQQMPAETPENSQPGDQGGASALPGVE